MAYRATRSQKKAFDLVDQGYKISTDSLEVQKKILQELEAISKKLDK